MGLQHRNYNGEFSGRERSAYGRIRGGVETRSC